LPSPPCEEYKQTLNVYPKTFDGEFCKLVEELHRALVTDAHKAAQPSISGKEVKDMMVAGLSDVEMISDGDGMAENATGVLNNVVKSGGFYLPGG
jgi:zona occludens toxin (predicted ATPase)